MCYMDRTFCPYKECLDFKGCPRALTDKVRARAKVWWGGEDVPISVYADRPDCFVPEEVKE